MTICAVCPKDFVQHNSMVRHCSPKCGMKLLAQKAKAERAQTKARKEAIKTRKDWIKDAQREFNKFIRLRDHGRACICCGQPLGASEVGGKYDCGHYRSVGSAPHLRFDERNAHGQNKQCNRYGAGRAVDYRRGLIARLGAEAVDALEADQATRKYTVADLKAIIAKYRQMAKELAP